MPKPREEYDTFAEALANAIVEVCAGSDEIPDVVQMDTAEFLHLLDNADNRPV